MTESQLPQPVTIPTAIRPVDRHELGDAIRRAWLKHGQDSWLTIADEVFAALAEPEPKGPTRRQLLQLAAEFWPEGCEPAQAVPFARAALARWCRPAPATAGEVGYLADFVRGCADDYESHGRCRLIRAADLLERQAAPQPGPEDCDAEGEVLVVGRLGVEPQLSGISR